MYLFYDSAGEVYAIYNKKPTTEKLQNEDYIEFDGEIPEKDGYYTKIYIKDSEVVFNFEKLPQIRVLKYIEELEEKNQKLETINKANMMAIMDIHKKINDLEGADE